MRKSGKTARQLALSYLIRNFFLTMMLTALLGTVLLYVSSSKQSPGHANAGLDLLRDLGIALLVSAFATSTIEWYAGSRLRTEIADDVLEATFQRLIPEKIFRQVADNVFRSNVWRRNWVVNLGIISPHDQPRLYTELQHATKDSHLYIANVAVSYVLENLNVKAIDYVLSGGVDLDPPIPSMGLPKFIKIRLGLAAPTKIPQEIAKTTLSQVGAVVSLDPYSFRVTEGQLVFNVTYTLPPANTTGLIVRYELQRAIRVPGMFVLSASAPADGITIRITGLEETVDFDVVPLHPDRGALDRSGDREWQFSQGLLPWQGFEVFARTSEEAG